MVVRYKNIIEEHWGPRPHSLLRTLVFSIPFGLPKAQEHAIRDYRIWLDPFDIVWLKKNKTSETVYLIHLQRYATQ